MSFTSQTPQPILAWNFNGTTTSYIGGVSPTVTNGTVSYQAGIYGQAFYINGSTSNVIYSGNISDIPANPGMTMCFWWNPTSTLAGNLLDLSSVTSGTVTNDRINVTLDGTGRLVVNFSQIASWTSPILGNGGWYHVAIVATNTSYSTYFNGIFQTTVTASFPTITTYGRNLSIGCLVDGTGTAGDGLIDDLCIYNKVLTATQIGIVYNTKGMPRLGTTSISSPNGYGTGGTITNVGLDRVHKFTTSGTFTCTWPGFVKLLVVAGGGGSGISRRTNPTIAGGGGAGGEVFYSTSYFLRLGTYSITIGAGGLANLKGASSTLGSSLSTNGGGGGGSLGAINGGSGGSGGGGAYYSSTNGTGGASILTAGGYGNNGANSPSAATAGAGGGAGGVAVTTTGGAGFTTDISGVSITYGIGGSSGAGAPIGGAANTGNGCTASVSGQGSGGRGGSGIVIIRYLDLGEPTLINGWNR